MRVFLRIRSTLLWSVTLFLLSVAVLRGQRAVPFPDALLTEGRLTKLETLVAGIREDFRIQTDRQYYQLYGLVILVLDRAASRFYTRRRRRSAPADFMDQESE